MSIVICYYARGCVLHIKSKRASWKKKRLREMKKKKIKKERMNSPPPLRRDKPGRDSLGYNGAWKTILCNDRISFD